MSDSEGRRRTEEATSAHHHHGRDPSLGHWSAPVTPTFSNGFNFEDDHDHHHAKKSVLAKVKEKAKKWKNLLAKKKHGHDDDNLTPPWGVSLDEEDEEQDPEYHGAPMYESETAPEAYREGTSQHRSAAVRSPGALEKKSAVHVQPDDINAKKGSEMKKQGNNKMMLLNYKQQPALKHVDAVKETSSSPHEYSFANNINRSPSSHNVPTVHQNVDGEKDNNKTLTETVTEMLTPAYTMVSGATQMIASKMQSPAGSTTTGYELGAKQVWDKGISVKEYLMHKLEPGEEDRALCQVITEAVSPRNYNNNNAGEAQGEVAGIVDKVKEAVSSLLMAREEVVQETQVPVSANPSAHDQYQRPIPVSTNPPPHAHEAPAPISTNQLHAPRSPNIPVLPYTNIHASDESSVPAVSTKNLLLRAQESPIPVSTNPRTEEEVETGGRRLQAYAN